MRTAPLSLAVCFATIFAFHATAATTFYVDIYNPAPAAPYTNWVTAATNIQDAVDASAAGDEVVVTDGVYQVGGRLVSGSSTTNRLVVDKAVTVRSVNGPLATMIQGQPAGANGGGPVRCAYLTDGAVLSGFTLTNGATVIYQNGGGVWCASAAALVTNCTLTGNSASTFGGGAYQGMLNNCTLAGNSASFGGGACSCTLNNCTLIGNSVVWLTGAGGGADSSTLNNCVLIGNSAIANAGGGGGAAFSTLNNCTVTGNSASAIGGGTAEGTLNNCIVYYNSAPDGSNYSGSTFNYSCTAPLPGGGAGNTNVEPQLASASHLSAGSPCRGAGSASYATRVDIDGEAWATPPSIGCDEYMAGAVTGALSSAIWAFASNTVPGLVLVFGAVTQGRTSASQWDFGDGTVVSNRAIASHAWTALGDYPVVLTAYNDTYPGGVSATVTVHVVEQVLHYVSLSSTKPVRPYASWATAATQIQDAIDAVYSIPNAVVLVSNGLYQTGTLMVKGDSTTNRLVVNKPITVRSVNGPVVTTILGKTPGPGNLNGPVRCAYLTNGAVLSGFTLTNGFGAYYGGGVYCASVGAVVSNCTLIGNSAVLGGGVEGGTLNNCTLIGNSAQWGGGAHSATASCILNNCTLTKNSAVIGGGTDYGTLNNCIVYYNTAPNGPNYSGMPLSYCCTTPLPGGPGNITNAPLFVDLTNNNLRLQSNSPCINSGMNAYAPGSTDLDGNPRIMGSTVDIGAYEYQTPASVISYAWLQQYGLPIDGSADYVDTDGDHLNNWQEWVCGTDPTNSLSVLKMLAASNNVSGVTVSWQSVSSRTYFLQRSTNLFGQPAFSPVQSNIVGQAGTTSFTDSSPPASGPALYRVGVQP